MLIIHNKKNLIFKNTSNAYDDYWIISDPDYSTVFQFKLIFVTIMQ